MADRIKRVIREIEEAFADVPYPEDENISPYEPEDVEAFRGRHWREVSVDLPPESWSSFYVSIWASFPFVERRQVLAGSGTRRSRSFASCVRRRCFSARE